MGTASNMETSFLLNFPLGEVVWALLFLICLSNSSHQMGESRGTHSFCQKGFDLLM